VIGSVSKHTVGLSRVCREPAFVEEVPAPVASFLHFPRSAPSRSIRADEYLVERSGGKLTFRGANAEGRPSSPLESRQPLADLKRVFVPQKGPNLRDYPAAPPVHGRPRLVVCLDRPISSISGSRFFCSAQVRKTVCSTLARRWPRNPRERSRPRLRAGFGRVFGRPPIFPNTSGLKKERKATAVPLKDPPQPCSEFRNHRG